MASRPLVAGVLVMAVAAVGCAGTVPPATTPSTSPSPTASGSASVSSSAGASGSAATRLDIVAAGAKHIDVAGEPDWLAVAGGSAWAAVIGGVRRLDGATGEPDGLVPIPGVICLAFDVGFDSLWAGSCDRHLLARIDPKTASLDTPLIDLPVDGITEEGSIGAGESGVWLISSDHQLLRLDPVTNQVDGQWPLPATAAAVRVGLDAVWVTIPGTDTLLRVDPADPTTAKGIKVGKRPRFLAVGEDGVWVMNQGDGSVSRVSGAGEVIATVAVSDVPIQGGDITVGGGRVWVRIEQDLVVTIDPATNAVVDRFGPPSGSGSVAVDDDAAWVSAHDTSSVYRLPLR